MLKKYGVDNGAASIGALLIVRGIKTHNLENEARDRHALNPLDGVLGVSFREKEEMQSLQIK